MQFLETLSQSTLILWVAESNYGYPTVLTLHSIGMALVVGILLMIDLRVVGVAKQISFSHLQQFFLVAWLGLAVNAISGTLLFLVNYSAFLENTAFITKISLLIIGGIGSYFLAKEIRLNSSSTTANDQPETYSQKARVIAVVCILLWLGAITAGRIVGYTSIPA